MKIYYFSSTGNSLYVAKRLIEELDGGELISITNKTKENEIVIDDTVIGFVYPIHCGSIPIVATDFFNKITIKGNPYIFAVGVTGGGGADLSFRHINKLLKDKGSLSNFFTLKYISNYIRAGKNASKDRIKLAIETNEPLIINIANTIRDREIKTTTSKLGPSFLAYKLWMNFFKKDKNFNVNESCIGCTICSDVCPTNNIKLKDKKPVWNGKCIDCMACINLCPQKAINIGASTLEKDRYKHPNIDIEELLNK